MRFPDELSLFYPSVRLVPAVRSPFVACFSVDRSDVGRHAAPPRGVVTPSAFSLSQIACNIIPRLRIDLIRRANLRRD
jgi:hypothetical protein